MATTRRQQQQQQQQPRARARGAQQHVVAQGAGPTNADYARFVTLQHGGLVLCVLGLALLACGYDAGWMHPTHLSILSLGLCLVGLFLHETRPYKVGDAASRQAADSHRQGFRTGQVEHARISAPVSLWPRFRRGDAYYLNRPVHMPRIT
jgi:hypothetical protein